MGRPRYLPSNRELQRLLDQGYSHADIVQYVFDTTGERVSRTSVSAAISRAGLSKPQSRSQETIPWRVKVEHIRDYQARVLRLLGRRMEGQSLNELETKRLDSWLRMLEADNAVVVYDPQVGFGYATRQPGDPTDVPIHIKPVQFV